MHNAHPISVLMLFTLISGVVIIAVALLYFLRKRGNRHPMEGQRERNIAEIRAEGPDADRT